MRSLIPCISLVVLLAACSSEPATVQHRTVTFDLRNGGAAPVFVHAECTIDIVFTELANPSRAIGQPSGCGICDCSASSCPRVVCGPCYEGAIEVSAAQTFIFSWTPIDMTYETRGTSTCSHTRVLPAGQYRIDIPVYGTMEDGAAKTNSRVISQTFEVPAVERIAVELAAAP
jgi:hypothetical protein